MYIRAVKLQLTVEGHLKQETLLLLYRRLSFLYLRQDRFGDALPWIRRCIDVVNKQGLDGVGERNQLVVCLLGARQFSEAHAAAKDMMNAFTAKNAKAMKSISKLERHYAAFVEAIPISSSATISNSGLNEAREDSERKVSTKEWAAEEASQYVRHAAERGASVDEAVARKLLGKVGEQTMGAYRSLLAITSTAQVIASNPDDFVPFKFSDYMIDTFSDTHTVVRSAKFFDYTKQPLAHRRCYNPICSHAKVVSLYVL